MRSIIAEATGGIAEDFAPEPKGEIARHEQRCVFVAACDELEEQVRGALKAGDPAHCGVEEDPVSVLGGLNTQCDGQVGLSAPWRAEQDHILRLGDERAGAQVFDQVPVGGGLMIEVEVLQRLMPREPGGLDPQRGTGCLAFGDRWLSAAQTLPSKRSTRTSGARLRPWP